MKNIFMIIHFKLLLEKNRSFFYFDLSYFIKMFEISGLICSEIFIIQKSSLPLPQILENVKKYNTL